MRSRGEKSERCRISPLGIHRAGGLSGSGQGPGFTLLQRPRGSGHHSDIHPAGKINQRFFFFFFFLLISKYLSRVCVPEALHLLEMDDGRGKSPLAQ